jgi:hypothetical protein
MKLIEKQRIFAKELGRLLGWAHYRAAASVLQRTAGYQHLPIITIRMAEGYVGDSAPRAYTHRGDGGHYKRIAQDLVVEVNGRWIKNSKHPVYKVLGEWWEKRGAAYPGLTFANGRTWGDGGHFSIEDAGVK